MAKIYHNPRCSKSRKALELLEQKNIEFEVKEYLKEGLSVEEVLELAQLLDKPVSEFTRSKEEEYKQFDIDWNDNAAAANALAQTPKLLERPIVINSDKGIVARPPELLEELF